MTQKEECLKDYQIVKQAFHNIQDYPLNAPAFFKELTPRQSFMASRLLTDYLYMTADVCAYEESLLLPLSADERQAVLRDLTTGADPSLVSDLPSYLDSVYMKITLNTDENLRKFYKQYDEIALAAFHEYHRIKPDPEKINARCENLCLLLNKVVNEENSSAEEEKPKKGLPPYIRVPADEIRSTLNTIDFFERKERMDRLRRELSDFRANMIDSTLEGLMYRARHNGRKLSETPEMKAKKLRQMKKERLIRKKLAAENKRLPQNKKRFSLNRILSALQKRTTHSF